MNNEIKKLPNGDFEVLPLTGKKVFREGLIETTTNAVNYFCEFVNDRIESPFEIITKTRLEQLKNDFITNIIPKHEK